MPIMSRVRKPSTWNVLWSEKEVCAIPTPSAPSRDIIQVAPMMEPAKTKMTADTMKGLLTTLTLILFSDNLLGNFSSLYMLRVHLDQIWDDRQVVISQ